MLNCASVLFKDSPFQFLWGVDFMQISYIDRICRLFCVFE